jgi:AcrR family transcriptional regulator
MKEISTRDRLLNSGTLLISQKGFEGVSIREICKHADTSINMVHHYFKNKDGLLATILENFNANVFEVPIRILAKETKSRKSFESRILLFFEETLEALIKNRLLLNVACKEQSKMEVITDHQQHFITFLEEGKKNKFVRKKLDSAMITGFLMDRLINQVQYAEMIVSFSGFDIINDLDYRQRWCESNIDLFFNGILKDKK